MLCDDVSSGQLEVVILLTNWKIMLIKIVQIKALKLFVVWRCETASGEEERSKRRIDVHASGQAVNDLVQSHILSIMGNKSMVRQRIESWTRRSHIARARR